MGKKYTWDLLNELAREWYYLDGEENKSAKLAKQEEIFNGVYSLMTKPKSKEAFAIGISEFFLRDWKSFNPERGDFTGFFNNRIFQRSKDSISKDNGGHTESYIDEQGNKERRNVQDSSLNESKDDGEGNSTSRIDQQADPNAPNPETQVILNESAYQCLSIILQMPERLKGRANNPTRMNYFRMFFTDGVSNFLRNQDSAAVYKFHEKELFRAMKIPFLDFFLIQECRTIPEIIRSNLKLYSELVEGRPNEMPNQPLPNDIYKAYLEKKEDTHVNTSAISQQWQAYRKFLKENLL